MLEAGIPDTHECTARAINGDTTRLSYGDSINEGDYKDLSFAEPSSSSK